MMAALATTEHEADEMSAFQTALARFGQPREPIPIEVAQDAVWCHYQIAGDVASLGSELDSTFRVIAPDGSRLILKLSHRADAALGFAFQSGAIAAVADAPGVVAPRLIPTHDGAIVFNAQGCCGYMQTELAGVLIDRAGVVDGIPWQIGRAVAALDLALARFDHPAAHLPILWSIRNFALLPRLLPHVADAGVSACVVAAMERFRADVLPRLPELPWQVIHNDPSPFNLLALHPPGSNAIGVIDFGDGGWGPRVMDLAIAAGHFARDPARPLGGAEDVIAGFEEVAPLSEDERLLLPGLIAARMAAMMLINHWRASLFPDDAAYIHKNSARAERALVIALRALSEDRA